MRLNCGAGPFLLSDVVWCSSKLLCFQAERDSVLMPYKKVPEYLVKTRLPGKS